MYIKWKNLALFISTMTAAVVVGISYDCLLPVSAAYVLGAGPVIAIVKLDWL